MNCETNILTLYALRFPVANGPQNPTLVSTIGLFTLKLHRNMEGELVGEDATNDEKMPPYQTEYKAPLKFRDNRVDAIML